MPTIKQFREERGWSQIELARRAGTNQENVSRWENDQRMPRADQLRAVALAFGVSMDAIELPKVERKD